MQNKGILRQFHKEKNRGSAMIVAIVVSMVVVVFCLSLLLVSYALFSSSVRRVTQNQCRELSKTISIELEKELTTPVYTSFDMQRQDVTDGKNLLWQYLRYNICQGNWPYFESESSTDHGEKSAYRYFTLAATGGDAAKYAAMADDISICIYWENDGSYVESKNDIVLCIKVTCTKGDQAASMLSKYNLSCMEYENAESDVDTGDDIVNPSKNEILKSERWSWSFLERE